MAESSPSPAAAEGNPPQSELGSNQPDPSQPPASVPVSVNPSLTSPPPAILPSLQNPYAPPHLPVVAPPTAPSFRPATLPVPVPSAPQFSPLPVQPPGVGAMPSMSAPMMMPPYAQPGQLLNPPHRTPYASMPNGFPAMPLSAPQGTIPPPGIPRYPSPYNPMVRPVYPLRLPGAMGSIPPLLRPPIPGIRGPIIPPVIRPAAISSVTPTEKPLTTVYVGKIASTVENDFVLSLLQLCGSVKNWKRAQDPTNGSPKGFGFCEFESPEGVLRALRLLSKLNVDGQELLINVTQATKEYLERYVEKKAENSKKLKETENVGAEKEEEGAASSEKSEPPKPSDEESKKDDKDAGSEEKNDTASFGIVTDEDREADRVALEKLSGMIEERLKNNPLPPPPPLPAADGSNNLNLEQLAKSKDGDSDVDNIRNGEDKKDDEMASDGKPSSEQDRPETSSPDRTKRNDRRSRDKERDLKREKERELERYEREREQERNRREREREYKLKEDDRRYKARVKEWESREREKEYLRKLDKEKEKEREYKRKREIMEQEHEGDDGDSKRRKHKSGGSEERKRRLREKEEDLADRLKEEEEVAEAKRRSDEELRQLKEREKDALEPLPGSETNASDKAELLNQTNVESKDKAVELTYDGDSGNVNHSGNGILQNGNGDESVMEAISASDMQQNNNISAKKLGFGLVGSGKRTTVPSVFNQEEDEDAHKDKKMRPLVPIDYSTEELQAVQSSISGAPSSNLAAAAEFAKRISGATSKEDRPDAERERSRRSHDRSSHRDRIGDDTNRTRDDSRKETFERDRDRDQKLDKVKTPDNKKLLDAKQLIDMIPKTKEELFSYEINWAIYDKNELHDRMRPWISKKITEFLGEEEPTLVDYIVSSTQEHVVAAEMLERLQSILDDEAEMFVLKMWRMLIFEIKKIESGLAVRSKS